MRQRATVQDPGDLGILSVSAMTLTALNVENTASTVYVASNMEFSNGTLASFCALMGRSYKRMAYWEDEPSFGVWVPLETSPGDLLVHLKGGRMPFVIRPSAKPAGVSRRSDSSRHWDGSFRYEASFIGVAAFYRIGKVAPPVEDEYFEVINRTLPYVSVDLSANSVYRAIVELKIPDNLRSRQNIRPESKVMRERLLNLLTSFTAVDSTGESNDDFQWQDWAIL
jgi:hypothetical protein